MPPYRGKQRARIVEAPLSLLQQLHELQQARDAQIARRMSQVDVFARLGFHPNCRVQFDAVHEQLLARDDESPVSETLRLLRDRAAAAAAGISIPARCGECPQERFVDLPDHNLDVLYGGAGGGGKSHSLLMIALRACIKYPGIQVFWFRRSFPELNQSVLRLLARFGFAANLGGRWNGSKYELRFPGGSILTFGHAKNLEEASALSSAEINLLILDERTTIPPDVVEFLYTRVRSGVAGVPCLGVRSASNPGFIGHRTVKEGWVDATRNGTIEIVDKARRRRVFIPAKVSDNPHIGDYAENLQGIEDPDLRRRILEGDWSVMPNGAFPDWSYDKHVVPAMEIPESWARYGGFDYGWTAPSVYLLAARDNDGRLWFYRELVMTQTPEREQARRVLSIEDVIPRVRAADPSMWGKDSSALPAASQFAIEGCALRKADNDRFNGKQRVHQFLASGPACAHHRALGWDVCPMLHVVDTGCPEFIAEMGSLPRDPDRPEDVDTKARDHAYDSGRYLIMSIGVAPEMIFDDDVVPDGLVQRGVFAFDAKGLSTPAERPEPGESVGVANPAGADWSQV